MIQNALAGHVITPVEGAKVPPVLREQGELRGKLTYGCQWSDRFLCTDLWMERHLFQLRGLAC